MIKKSKILLAVVLYNSVIFCSSPTSSEDETFPPLDFTLADLLVTTDEVYTRQISALLQQLEVDEAQIPTECTRLMALDPLQLAREFKIPLVADGQPLRALPISTITVRHQQLLVQN